MVYICMGVCDVSHDGLIVCTDDMNEGWICKENWEKTCLSHMGTAQRTISMGFFVVDVCTDTDQ